MFGCVIRRFYGRLAANKVKITDVLYKKSSLKQALVKVRLWVNSKKKSPLIKQSCKRNSVYVQIIFYLCTVTIP